MNITTYCCPVTIAPTRRMAVALYTHTATARNMLATGEGVLQVLRAHHADLVPLLGRSSAHDVDKAEALRERGVEVVERYGVPTIADAMGVVHLRVASLETAGDHHLALCDVLAYENIEGEGEPLYTKDLPK
jgi:flavin reductase (DIM6/NTAB) family NADH-FMN oxidoreductase RutF